MLPTSIYTLRIEYDLELIRYPLKCRVWEARNSYNFIRDDALQVAVCVIAIFLDILYGNLLLCYSLRSTRKKMRKKQSLCLYSHSTNSTNCVGMNKICFCCSILSSCVSVCIVCRQAFSVFWICMHNLGTENFTVKVISNSHFVLAKKKMLWNAEVWWLLCGNRLISFTQTWDRMQPRDRWFLRKKMCRLSLDRGPSVTKYTACCLQYFSHKSQPNFVIFSI